MAADTMAVLERYAEIRLRQRQLLTRGSRGHIPFVRTSTTRRMELFVSFLEEVGARRPRYDLLAQPTIVVGEIGKASALLTPEEFHRHLEENLQAMAARQHRERAPDGPASARQSRRWLADGGRVG